MSDVMTVKLGDIAYVLWVDKIITASVSLVSKDGNSVKLEPSQKRDYVDGRFTKIAEIHWTWEAARAQLVMEHDKQVELARTRLCICFQDMQDAMAMQDPTIVAETGYTPSHAAAKATT